MELLPDGDARARMSLTDSPATRAIWPVAFLARLTVRIGGGRLAVSLAVENRNPDPISFTAALHTYLRVREVEDTRLDGLQGSSYRESRAPGELRVDTEPSLQPIGEVDRVYVGVQHPLVLREPGHSFEISATGFPDVVVWNPGAEKAAAMSDMEPGGERHMLCVEAAAVQQPVQLAPGETWQGEQVLHA